MSQGSHLEHRHEQQVLGHRVVGRVCEGLVFQVIMFMLESNLKRLLLSETVILNLKKSISIFIIERNFRNVMKECGNYNDTFRE